MGSSADHRDLLFRPPRVGWVRLFHARRLLTLRFHSQRSAAPLAGKPSGGYHRGREASTLIAASSVTEVPWIILVGKKTRRGLTLFHCATSGVTLCSAAPCSGLEARDFPFKRPCHLNQHLAQCTRSHLIPGHVQRACAYFHTPGCDDGLVSISWPQQDTTRVHVCLGHKSMWIRLLPQVQTQRRKTPLWLRRLRDLR